MLALLSKRTKRLADKPSELSTEFVGPFVDNPINSPKDLSHLGLEKNVDLLAPSNLLLQQKPPSGHAKSMKDKPRTVPDHQRLISTSEGEKSSKRSKQTLISSQAGVR